VIEAIQAAGTASLRGIATTLKREGHPDCPRWSLGCYKGPQPPTKGRVMVVGLAHCPPDFQMVGTHIGAHSPET
jgi:hypothetical protein